MLIKLRDVNLDLIYSWIIDYGIRLIVAILLLIIGLKLIKLLTKGINNRIDKSNVDPSLKSFISPLIGILLKTLLFITIVSIFGIEMTSFIAILASFGFAVGLALQGSLSNFAGGILILILKPYRVGDFIEASGFSGTVKDIQIFHTVLSTTDNIKVLIQNSGLANSTIINYSVNKIRRLELNIYCSYKNDVLEVKKILEDYINSNEKILNEPKSTVYLGEYGESSIKFILRAWVSSVDYWPTYYKLLLNIQNLFRSKGIIIPSKQLDVHIKEKGN